MLVDKADRRWVLGFALVLMLATTLPYILAYQLEGTDSRFTGLVFAVEDGNSYIAKMIEGSAGNWLFRTPYTAYPQTGMLAFFPYLLLGKLVAPPGQHEQAVVLFHLARIAGGVLFCLASYDFLSLFIRDRKLRRWGLALAAFGGGFGWLALLGLGRLWSGGLAGLEIPLEYYSPELFGFLEIFGLPHLAFARALLLWGLVSYIRMGQNGSERWIGLRGGLLWLGMGLMQPLTIVVGWAVLAAHLGGSAGYKLWQNRARKKQGIQLTANWNAWACYARRAAWMVAVSSPLVVYNLFVFKLDPTLKGWGAQNQVTSPPVWHFLLAYGLLLPLMFIGVRRAFQGNPWLGWLAVGWIIAAGLMAYAPFGLQRRLTEGVWVAIVVLAVGSLDRAGDRLRRWGVAYLSLSYIAMPLLFVGGLMSVQSVSLPLYRTTDEVKAFEYLESSAPKDW